MEDKFEQKLRELLPYIIITGILFLLLPLFMSTKVGAATYIVQMGAFPLTAVGCSVHYALVKKQSDLSVCVIAPLFYAISALLYGMWRDSWITVLIYIAAYFVCGYLGLMLSDILRPDKQQRSDKQQPEPKRLPRRPRRVNVPKEPEPAEEFQPEDPAADSSLDTSTTEDDIEAILNEIHNRKAP